MKEQNTKNLVTVGQYAILIKKSSTHVYNLIRAGRLEETIIGGISFVDKNAKIKPSTAKIGRPALS